MLYHEVINLTLVSFNDGLQIPCHIRRATTIVDNRAHEYFSPLEFLSKPFYSLGHLSGPGIGFDFILLQVILNSPGDGYFQL